MKNLSINDKILYGFLLIVMLLAWLNFLDKIAYELNMQSLKETSAAFVVLKSFDSLISLAKDFPFIGSLFAPYKDFLDRMSFVMLISFLSLGLQKVIIVAMQSFIINFVLTIGVLAVVINGLTGFLSRNAAKKLLKFVVLMIFIRFVIPLLTFVVVSIQTEAGVMATAMHQERIELLEKKLLNINELAEKDKLQKQENKEKLIALKQKLETLEETKESLEDKKSAIRNEQRSTLDRMSSIVKDIEDSAETAKNLVPVNQKLVDVEKEIISISESIEELKEPAFYSVKDKLKEKIKVAMANINTFVEDMFDIFLTSVILFFFTNVFFPIFFIWVFFRLIDSAFGTTTSSKLKTIAHSKLDANEASGEIKR